MCGRALVVVVCIPRQPDLIILSAGFDGSARDIGNQKHVAHKVVQGMDLHKRDYLWLTQEIRHVAGAC